MKIIASVLLSTVVFLFLSSIIPTRAEAEIYSSTLRLHVLANSDSKEDQELKLKVRDRLLSQMSEYDVKSKEEAVIKVNESKDELIKMCEDVVKNEGFDYKVTIEVGKEIYQSRDYEDFSLPAGEYTSVRVIIGEGEGKNWWCVLYPPLCTNSAVKYDDGAYVDVGLTKDQYALITGKSEEYKIKFKILEVASQIFNFKYE